MERMGEWWWEVGGWSVVLSVLAGVCRLVVGWNES